MSAEDKAQEIELAHWEFNNRSKPEIKFTPSQSGYGPVYCSECGDDMPTARREYGFHQCTDCKSAIEKREAYKSRH